MGIVRFTRFRVAAEREQHVLAARLTSLRACHGSEPGLRGAYLVRLGDNEWLDIAMWDGHPRAEDLDDPARAAARSVFYGQIDELLGEECGIIVDDELPQP